MALQMEYTDEFGVKYLESYWRVAQISISQAQRRGMIQFYGYSDAANRGKRIIGQKQYSVGTEDYDDCFGVDALNPEGINPSIAAYDYAKGATEINGARFFANAIDA